ncbi:MAG: sigma-70 family RNA polymerase sigma factor [bacterium]
MSMALLPTDAPDDRILMQRACQGDREAFSELVRRHQRPLMNFFRRCGVQTDAEDLVQQTFIRLYRYRDRYQPSAKLTTFLYLLARQVWIDELRRRQRTERLRKGLEAEPQLEFVARGEGPERGKMDIEAALAALPEGMRMVVVMSIYQNMVYEDIALALQIPVGTVKSRMFNALRLLRQAMEERHE